MAKKEGKTLRFSSEVSFLCPVFWILFGLGLYWFFMESLAWPSFWSIALLPIFFLLNFIYNLSKVYKLDDKALSIQMITELANVEYHDIRAMRPKDNSWVSRIFLGAPKTSLMVAYNKYDDIVVNVRDKAKFEKELRKRVPEVAPYAHSDYA